MPIEDFIIKVYVCVDDFIKQLEKLRKHGFEPKLSDSEVLTMEIVGEFLGLGSGASWKIMRAKASIIFT
jgi:hypothetical protein